MYNEHGGKCDKYQREQIDCNMICITIVLMFEHEHE